MKVSLADIQKLASELRTSPDDRPELLLKMTPDPTSVPYYKFLHEFARRFRPALCVEIGTGWGGSAVHLAAGNPDGNVITLDTNPGAKKIIDATGLSNLIAVTDDSIRAASLLKLLPPIDLLFIDGEHNLKQAFAEYAAYRPLMKDGGIILFDDLSLPLNKREMESLWDSVVDPKVRLDELHYTGFGAAQVDPRILPSIPNIEPSPGRIEPMRANFEVKGRAKLKLGAAIPVLNEWRFMPAVTAQLLKIVDQCVILHGSRSTSGAPVEIGKEIPALDPRVEILDGNWRTESETRNAGMEFLSDCDYVFMVDSDEILLDEDLQTLRRLCEEKISPVIAVRLYTNWKTPHYRVDPPEEGSIKMVLRKDVRIHGIREVSEPVYLTDVRCRHLSYVRTDLEMKEKLRLWGHSHEVRPGWFEGVWKAWDENHDLENLHPVHPGAYRRAIYYPDRELEAVLNRWSCI